MPIEFKHGQAYQHIENGQHLERLGRMDEAMLEFKRAIDADPSVAAAHVSLGHHYQRKGLLTKAADEFHSATMLDRDYESYFDLGRVLTDLERYDEAQEAFRACISLDSQDPTARYELAYVLCAQGKYSEGLTIFLELVQEYPDDWELQLAIANCQIGLKDYAAAESILRQALATAPEVEAQPVREALLLCLRTQEYPVDQEMGVKESFYADYGIAALGSGRDDGLAIPVYADYTFTYRDVAITLHRLLALVRSFNWPLTAVVSVDEDALPLAIALSHLLGTSLLQVEELHSEDLALVVVGIGTQPEVLEVTLEHVPCAHISCALALPWQRADGLLTDITGVGYTGECVLPWKRPRRRSHEAAAASILRALSTVPIEATLPELVAYYTHEHRLLRFLDLSKVLQPRECSKT